MDQDEDFVYSQAPALPVGEESGSEVAAYLLSVRREALAGPLVMFVSREEQESVITEEPSQTQTTIQKPHVNTNWSENLLKEFQLIKTQLKDISHSPNNTRVPKSSPDWRKYLLEEPPEISYFFTTLDRQTLFKLLVSITKWLSITSRPTLSQWLWKIFIRIDNVLNATECSVIRDLGKKAVKIKLKQLAADKDVDAVSKYTVDMVLVIVAKPRRETGGMIAQTLPMAAMFMRNKVLSWSAFFLAVQAYLNEPINKPVTKDGEQPGILKVLFAFIAVLTCYIDVLFPGTNPAVQKAAKLAAETTAAAAGSA